MCTFGQRLNEARRRANLSQAELARRIGANPSSINRIESGESKGAKPEHLATLARVLKVSMEWLATGQEDRATEPRCSYNMVGIQERLIAQIKHLSTSDQALLLRIAHALEHTPYP